MPPGNAADPLRPAGSPLASIVTRASAAAPQDVRFHGWRPAALSFGHVPLGLVRSARARHGDVFTPDLIETWVELKRAEIQAIAMRPHPHEFELYYAI